MKLDEVGDGYVVVDEAKIERFEIFTGEGLVDGPEISAGAGVGALKVFEVLTNGAAAGGDFGGLALGKFGGGIFRGERWGRESQYEGSGYEKEETISLHIGPSVSFRRKSKWGCR